MIARVAPLALFVVASFATATPAFAKDDTKPAHLAARAPDPKRSSSGPGKMAVICSGKGAARRCHRERRGGAMHAWVPETSTLRTEPLPRPSGHVKLYNVAYDQTIEVELYNEDGSFNQESLAILDHAMRCRRTGEEHAADPRLYEVMSLLYDHYGKPVELYSGFRFQQNEGSRHFHASAMDIRIAGVSYEDVFEFAQTLDLGGMGIGRYPTEDFVHIDYRAPGESSMRWTDTGHVNESNPGKQPSRYWKSGAKPNS